MRLPVTSIRRVYVLGKGWRWEATIDGRKLPAYDTRAKAARALGTAMAAAARDKLVRDHAPSLGLIVARATRPVLSLRAA